MSESTMLRPKFVNAIIVQTAIEAVLDMVFKNPVLASQMKRTTCHIVVLGPSIRNGFKYPNVAIEPCILGQHTYGDPGTWNHPFNEIAQCKALQLWHDRNDGSMSVAAHLLFAGDTYYWGGVKREGLVVACSGIQPHFDRMISGMIADMIIGLAHNELENCSEVKAGEDFLSFVL